ncbi:MAG: carboxypeptidase M32 [Firmicutes bacterium]|nr:carboxypeptidase M32 [Bacillota bacterium]
MRLRTLLGETADLEKAGAVLGWDQQTYMPPDAAGSRSAQMVTLATLAYDRFVNDEVGQLLERLSHDVEALPYDSFARSLIRVTRRKYQRERKLSRDLVGKLAEATTLGHHGWLQAREQNRFEVFCPYLERIVDLVVQKAEALGYPECRYDALLDEFEPEMRTSRVEALFSQLKEALVPLVQAIRPQVAQVDDSFLHRHFDEKKQWDFGLAVLQAMGFDFRRGRMDSTVHPFTTAFSPTDVRITTHVVPDNLASCLFSVVHEGGHALYEQGIPLEFERTPLGEAPSFGVHESQSRLWENLVGRSRPFWRHFLPVAQSFFPAELRGVDLEAMYRAVNRVEPSLIRTDADEVTYNLHIFVRFDLERQLVDGKLAVKDLPEAWNALMQDYLGVVPRNPREGVLQDVHWSDGSIGYFPSYTLGNLLAVQFFDQARKECPGLEDEMAAGRFGTLKKWLNERIHALGGKYTPAELVSRVTGTELQAEPYIRYIRSKYGEIYGL